MLLFISSLQFWVCQSFSFSSSHLCRSCRTTAYVFSASSLFSSSNDDDKGTGLGEETLLKISMSINEGYNVEDIVPVLQQYLTSFPFSAVLPVQPLTYTPRSDGQGVSVSFLRKKTQEKSSIDGGIEFTFAIDTDDVYGESSGRVIVEAKRVSEGQVISKVFSEGTIVKAFVNGLNHGETDGGRVGIGHGELLRKCSVESIFHKWM